MISVPGTQAQREYINLFIKLLINIVIFSLARIKDILLIPMRIADYRLFYSGKVKCYSYSLLQGVVLFKYQTNNLYQRLEKYIFRV
jgi:hypothetical protein